MYSLSYESIHNGQLREVEIEKIITKWREYNKANSITGCLMTYKHKCIQILEGPKDAIKALYNTIESDNRHHNTSIFSENPIDERAFPEFTMAYLPITLEGKDKSGFQRLKMNIAILSDFTNPVHTTAVLFWKKIKEYIDSDAASI
ncbi:BLUF domain-containing protein [Zobellia galactanivorans]|uniref:BLUF domain-containing protein n=1 Tax=Zobellia galactanivorans (strain DSM 12802 / CCUG 47099 / CIP 106680 / NCIMB 13871 / Dsij) TaxID=63186 RepID=UPI001C0751B7|nr:BLUF domain-containing protein [Zobellia galactanivorans]MBU3027032.1 BLUF domain-containing protein [Zobellia galactanivorans]MDO6811129.1 BLUF domain-containing protein [Zobellia galactanivorans]